MKPSDHLAYFGEHEVIKKNELKLLAGKVLINFADKYDEHAEIQAMRELSIASSILEAIGESEMANKLSQIEAYIHKSYTN